ncbi:MAG: hypothetical protein ACM3O7_10715 [Acidobacteriota bacterium]
MLRVLPLASPITPPDAVAAVIESVSSRLAASGATHSVVIAAEDADALLIVSGGTEHLALAALERGDGPAILLAHPDRNSLPAALEILTRVRQRGRAGRIVLVKETADADEAVARLGRQLEIRGRLRTARLGRIGAPSDWLVASTPGVAEVASAWGPALVDVPLEELVEELHHGEPGEIAAIRANVAAGAGAVVEPSPADLDTAAAVAAALRRVVGRHHLDACTVRCFDLVVDRGTTGCLAISWLLDEGIVAGCEGDVPATLTMLWLQLTTGQPAFMANPQDVDPAANTVDLAHCTIARRLVSHYTLRSHFESSMGVGIAGTVGPGPATLARVGGADLREAFLADGEIVASGDSERRCRTQVRLRLETPVADLLVRPIGNHHVLARGHWAAELRDYHELFVARA